MTPKDQLEKDLEGRYLIPLFDINTIGRARQDMGDIQSLATDIKTLGLIQPIILDPVPKNDRWNLVAGGRRLMACGLAGFAKAPCLFKNELTELQRLMMELSENDNRKDMEMLERIALTDKIDRLNRAVHGDGDRNNPAGWTRKKTAKAMNVSEATVTLQVQLHNDLAKMPELKERIQKNQIPFTASLKLVEQFKQMAQMQQRVKDGGIILSNDIRLGDARVLIKDVPTHSVSLLLWDPPYGNSVIEENEGGRGEGGTQSYTAQMCKSDNLSFDESVQLIRDLSGDLARVLVPGAHFYIFHAEDLLPVLKHYLEYFKLVCVRPVNIWKKNRNTTAANGYNFMSSYEPFLYGYKPPENPANRRRLAEPRSNVFEYAAPGRDKIHVFQKPIELLVDLIKLSTLPGELVFDPSCGSGMSIQAARACGRSGLGFEIDEKNFQLAQRALLESTPTV